VTWPVWIAFAVLEATLCITPGPAVLLVMSRALRDGVALALWTILGILTANGVYFAISGSGVGAILAGSGTLFFAIKWVGAAYLIYLGAVQLFGRAAKPEPTVAVTARVPNTRRVAEAFAMQMANPKVLLFFAALLPQFIDPHALVAPQVGLLWATSSVLEISALVFYAMLAGHSARLAGAPRFAPLAYRLSGVALMVVGIGMAALRRA
jgi:homoserine/homoserine lactone efflux protein